MKAKNAPQVAPIKKMRYAAEIVSKLLINLSKKVEPGMSLLELDRQASILMKKYGVTSADKNYHPKWAKKPFPGHICTSVNNCIAHGIPTPYKLKDGDIVNIDIGIKVNGVCGDSAITCPVGDVSQKNKDLLKFAYRTCQSAIQDIAPGVRVVDVARNAQNYANLMGYRVNWAFVGHGIGKEMHQPPEIPFFYDDGQVRTGKKNKEIEKKYLKYFSGVFQEGMVVCIEPMITEGFDRLGYLYKDGWSRLTRDGEYSAMFEEMVLVTKTGHEKLTNHLEGLYD